MFFSTKQINASHLTNSDPQGSHQECQGNQLSPACIEPICRGTMEPTFNYSTFIQVIL